MWLRQSFFRKRDVVADLLVLASLWILAVVLINPYGDFPLNDDWSYGKAVKHLMEDGVFHPTGWTAMSLIAQVLWGTLFCIPFGFSFTALRVSTLVLALAGVLGTYLLLKTVKAPRSVAFTAALVLGSNPIYLALSNTFMTDVPFTAFTVLGLLFLMRCVQGKSDIYLAAGTFFSTAAILCRQIGLFLPMAFAFPVLVKNGISLRTLLRAGLPAMVGAGALIGFESWLRTSADLPVAYVQKQYMLLKNMGDLKSLVHFFPNNLLMITLYLGLFLFPLLVVIPNPAGGMSKRRGLWCISIFALFSMCSTGSLLVMGRCMPLAKNILTAGGIGPVTLHDVFILKLPHVPQLSSQFWLFISAMSIIGGGLLLVCIFSALHRIITHLPDLKRDQDSITLLFLLSACTMYCFPILIDWFRDRYVVPLIPLLCTFLAVPERVLRPGRQFLLVASVLVLLCPCFLFSVSTTRDYLAWNRTRWKALRALVEHDRVSPSEIDGGFEFNGWYLYDPNYSRMPRKSWWWVNDDYYLVTLGPVSGYEIVRHYSFDRWVPAQESHILVLRRQDPR